MKHSLTLVTALLVAPLAAGRAADAPAPAKPNVLFVVFDDLNNRLGCYGDPVAKSPNLDRLAARGTVFTRNFCQQPICGPSRASFMSGRRPDSLGIWSMTKYLYDLHPDAVTIPQWFMRHGYTAMSIGKVLGGYGKEADFKTLSVPDRRTGGKTKDEFAMPDGVPLPPNLAKDRLCEKRDVPDEACFDTVSANLAIAELRALAKKPEPFFLALGLFKPHTPYKIPKRYWDLYRRENIPAIETPARPRNAPDLAFHANHEFLGEPNARRTLDDESKRELRHGYYAAMSFADAQFGKLLDALEELKLADNTIVVIIGDNGFQLGEHDCWGKMTLFGWDARVPLIISVPDIGKGRREGGSPQRTHRHLPHAHRTLRPAEPVEARRHQPSARAQGRHRHGEDRRAHATSPPCTLLGRRAAGVAAGDGLRSFHRPLELSRVARLQNRPRRRRGAL